MFAKGQGRVVGYKQGVPVTCWHRRYVSPHHGKTQLPCQAALIRQRFVWTDESHGLAALIPERDFGRHPPITPHAPSPAPLWEGPMGNVRLGLMAPISGPPQAFVAPPVSPRRDVARGHSAVPGRSVGLFPNPPSETPLPTAYMQN